MLLPSTKGMKHPSSKLTDQMVYEIRRRYDAGEPRTKIAVDYNISPCHVVKIGKRRGWKHLPEEFADETMVEK